MKLRGNHCQCSGCLEYFNSTSVFTRHRVGDWQNRGANRRCLSVVEMEAKGWLRNAGGFWIEKARQAIDPARQRRDTGETVSSDPLSLSPAPPLPADVAERGGSSIPGELRP